MKARVTYFNKEILVIIESFCINFSKIQEAQDLQKLVKAELY